MRKKEKISDDFFGKYYLIGEIMLFSDELWSEFATLITENRKFFLSNLSGWYFNSHIKKYIILRSYLFRFLTSNV